MIAIILECQPSIMHGQTGNTINRIGYAVKIRIKTTKTVMLIKVKESVFKMHIEVRELGKMKTFVWPT